MGPLGCFQMSVSDNSCPYTALGSLSSLIQAHMLERQRLLV